MVKRAEAQAEYQNGYEIKHRIVRPNGEIRWVHEIASIEYDDNGAVSRFIGTVQDITDYKKLEEKLRLQASTDELTRLANRRSFMQSLVHEYARYERHPEAVASVLMLDIDFFKRINDTFGHAVGDDVLVQLAQLMAERFRKTDMLGRLGGEEFAVLMPHTLADEAEQVAEVVRQAIADMDIVVNGVERPLSITISIGVSQFLPSDQRDDEGLLRADNALYQAKSNGRNKVVAYQNKKG